MLWGHFEPNEWSSRTPKPSSKLGVSKVNTNEAALAPVREMIANNMHALGVSLVQWAA